LDLLQPSETDLDGFKVTLVVGGHDTVSQQQNADELFKVFSQLLIKTGGIIICLELIGPCMLLLILADQNNKKPQDNREILRAMCCFPVR
jgi:hypothetical protein